MLFNSINFLIFFPIVVLIYFTIPKKIKNIWLLVASYYFYMCWNAKYALLIAFSTVVTYLSGIAMQFVEDKKISEKKIVLYKKLIVGMSFTVNLSILALFKYLDFFVANLNRVLGFLNVQFVNNPFDLVLPVGISFYTFQALGYTVDVYRKDIEPEKNLLTYALFVSFFPQLVAGPIERSGNLLNQLKTEHSWNYERIKNGILIMLWGYFQKVVIADSIAVVVNTIYNNTEEYAGAYLLVATVLFAVEIYCDFSGYSVIAMGAAKVLGIDLMENFRCPYFADSVADFWRRWHISLSSWFRDYLYIPLGGNRCSKVRHYFNLVLTFFVSGMWHGAKWSFIVWGTLNGIYQVIGKELKGVRDYVVDKLKIDRNSFSHKLFKVMFTFVLIDFTWIFFRADSLTEALRIIKSILTVRNYWIIFDGSLYTLGLERPYFWSMIVSVIVLAVVDFVRYRGGHILAFIENQAVWFRWAVYITSLLCILIFGVYGPAYAASEFIYFQF